MHPMVGFLTNLQINICLNYYEKVLLVSLKIIK